MPANFRISMPKRCLKPRRRSHRSWWRARRSWVCRPGKTREDSSSTRNRCTSSIFSISARGRRMCACVEHRCGEPRHGGHGQRVRHQGFLLPQVRQQCRGVRGCLGASANAHPGRPARGGGRWRQRRELAGEAFFARLQRARRLWRRRLAGRPLPWFASEKAGQGAFAAFLGLQIDAHTNRWTALAVGDCCLMQVDDVGKGMRVLTAFPLQESSQFTMSPYLIGSRSDGEQLHDRIHISNGSLRDGDMLLLATDAMAAWLLKQHEAGRPLWRWLYRKLRTPESFAAMVAYGRTHGLRNDDFTLVRIIHHDSPVAAKER